MGFSRYTVRNIVHKMLNVFLNLRHLINHGTSYDYERLQTKFCKRARSRAFCKFVGAIDGTHIRIQCPRNKHDEYINHKGYYSIQVQAVADSDGKFTNVFVGFPGSVHDNRVFRNSPLYKDRTYPLPGYYLLGDKGFVWFILNKRAYVWNKLHISGYPCRTTPVPIITPFKPAHSEEQRRFNAAHSRARIVVECAFGILKTRWRNIFNRDLELSLENSIKTTFAAFVLHNICILKNDFNPQMLYENIDSEDIAGDPTDHEMVIDTDEGIRVRNEIFNEFLSESNT